MELLARQPWLLRPLLVAPLFRVLPRCPLPCSRYYVRSLLNLDEKDLKNAWSKVGQGGEGCASLGLCHNVQPLAYHLWAGNPAAITQERYLTPIPPGSSPPMP